MRSRETFAYALVSPCGASAEQSSTNLEDLDDLRRDNIQRNANHMEERDSLGISSVVRTGAYSRHEGVP